jgi:hypothetical protein
LGKWSEQPTACHLLQNFSLNLLARIARAHRKIPQQAHARFYALLQFRCFSDPGHWDALVVGVIGSTEKFENRPLGTTISSFLRVGMPWPALGMFRWMRTCRPRRPKKRRLC